MMARASKSKYRIGDNVRHFTGIHGRVTAVFTRGWGSAYEFTYLKDGTEPTCCTCEECELEELPDGKAMIGFRQRGVEGNSGYHDG